MHDHSETDKSKVKCDNRQLECHSVCMLCVCRTVCVLRDKSRGDRSLVCVAVDGGNQILAVHVFICGHDILRSLT